MGRFLPAQKACFLPLPSCSARVPSLLLLAHQACKFICFGTHVHTSLHSHQQARLLQDTRCSALKYRESMLLQRCAAWHPTMGTSTTLDCSLSLCCLPHSNRKTDTQTYHRSLPVPGDQQRSHSMAERESLWRAVLLVRPVTAQSAFTPNRVCNHLPWYRASGCSAGRIRHLAELHPRSANCRDRRTRATQQLSSSQNPSEH